MSSNFGELGVGERPYPNTMFAANIYNLGSKETKATRSDDRPQYTKDHPKQGGRPFTYNIYTRRDDRSCLISYDYTKPQPLGGIHLVSPSFC